MLLVVTIAVSDFVALGGSGRWVLIDDVGSSETTASSLEFRRTGQKMSEADLKGAWRVGARLSTDESLEERFETDVSECVGIGGNGASSGSFVNFFVPQIDVSERDTAGRSGASDAAASGASPFSLFRRVHQEDPAFCTFIVSVLSLSIPPVDSSV
jgi:hypothetical protein